MSSVWLLPARAVEFSILNLLGTEALGIESMNLRQLRSLPAIGHGRARVILGAQSQARRRGESLAWQDIPGIGPKTEAKLQRWLDQREIDFREPKSKSPGQ